MVCLYCILCPCYLYATIACMPVWDVQRFDFLFQYNSISNH